MNHLLLKFVYSFVFLLASTMLGPRLLQGQANGNAWISASVFGHPLTISTSTQYAGAVTSFYWNGKEFVDNYDHGRQFQTAASFFNRYECYNPNEAGSHYDGQGPTSSSQLLWLTKHSNVSLESQTRPAFFRLYNDGDAACGDRSQWEPAPPLSGQPSNYQVHKKITIGYAGIQNVVEYLTDLWIPEAVTSVHVSSLEAIMPYEFLPLWNYDVISKTFRRIWNPGGEDEFVKMRAAGDGHALAFYSPDLLQPYDGTGFRWSSGPVFGGWASIGGLHRRPVFNGPGYLNFRQYLVLGSKDQVKSGLDSLHYQFRNLDPDVFNWSEYLEMYPDVAYWFPGRDGAKAHWTVHGINEGRNGSRTFSPAKYLELYPELGNPGNYQFAIDNYIQTGREAGRSTVKKAEAGFRHGIVLSTGGPKSAGWNAYGQLGNGTFTNSTVPVAATGLSQITEVSGAEYATLALRADGTLWFWGSNQYGLRGNGTTGGNVTQPTQVPNISGIMTPNHANRRAISINFLAAAAVDDFGQVWTWGYNGSGQLGDGTRVSHYYPMRVKKSSTEYLTEIVSISAGYGHMAALDAEGQVWTWGSGYRGGLGTGSEADSLYAVRILTDEGGHGFSGIAQIACGGTNFVLALHRNGDLSSWGNNSYGQLGLGDTALYILKPRRNTTLSGFTKIAAGGYHAVAKSNWVPRPVAWGYNGNGQLGNPAAATTQRSWIEMEAGPEGMNGITDVAAGSYFSMMIRGSDRTVFTVGDNANGQLGLAGNQTNQSVPRLSGY
jgi:alpha-tubulin suppressor-like RCC1 family protein